MKAPQLLLCEDESWERTNHPTFIKSAWKEIFNEPVDIHSCSDIVDEESPAPPALELARVGQYDALLLDVWWGDADHGTAHGVDIAKRIRVRYPELPIIVLSGKVQPEEFHALIPLGIAAYLTKSDDKPHAWCLEINRVLEQGRRGRPGRPLFHSLRRLLADRERPWCCTVVGEAASEVWRHENPYQKWEMFWARWATYLGSRAIKVPCDELAGFFAKQELLMLSVHPGFRGHLEHVLHVYFTGYIIAHAFDLRTHVLRAVHNLLGERFQNSQADTYWEYFNICWLIAGTLHDVAYPLEMLPDVVREAGMIQSWFPFAQFDSRVTPIMPTNVDWLSDDGKAMKAAAHSIFGRLYNNGALAEAIVNNVVYADKGVRRFNHGIASGARFLSQASTWSAVEGSLPIEFVQWTSVAMALHSLKHVAKQNGIMVSLQVDPLAFLLCLCDELQVWNRNRPDETPSSTHFRKVELHSLEVAAGAIRATIEYDLFPLIDESRKAAAINAVTSRLNKDQMVLQGFLKPVPLELVIKNCVREPYTELPHVKLS
jgi:DNA-binding NarL/FixJ family response regulator